MMDLSRCPGLYCGRFPLPDGNWSSCTACPRGFRANAASICEACNDNPTFYDWLYLGFMVMFPLICHWFAIDSTPQFRGSFNKEALILHLTAFVEVSLAAILTLLLVDPVGSYQIRSCKVDKLQDWYTVFYNPNPHYEYTLHCTQEAVFPLYTMVFIFYLLNIIVLTSIRPLIVKFFIAKGAARTVYFGLYLFPILALIHLICGGLIYYSFAYITIVLSVVSMATHFAFKLNQSVEFLLVSTITDLRNCLILLGHWALHAYGLVVITQPHVNPLLIVLLVPTPALFYILTSRFTDPNHLHSD
uniref:JNK1/MAPK8-associated membrane protein n=1 Tax=Cacopsylla melanoneura TaxID=428564 RepID=A0A8D8XHA6_9HEMI